ncbi:ABC transporter ATP-binding protein [Halobacteriales archaeon QS_1_68_20]|nr:MAG: ABC transporter ATP-binding protein [Halobacteriales archaeon QS_1_68_20]
MAADLASDHLGRASGEPGGTADAGPAADIGGSGAGVTDDGAVAPGTDGVGDDVVLDLQGVTKAYGTETAVEDLSVSIREGELLTLLGPSGCGKTTTLRLVAGLERPTAGSIELAGRTVADDDGFHGPDERDVGLVFQDFALFPHLTVAENVAFGLTDEDEAGTEARVAELLELVGMSDLAERKPDQLPDVLLLDEPFSNLDVRLRVEMREEVRAILKEAGVTAISVTHDQEEALSISDRIAVMNRGTVEQVGEPTEVFQHPESRFVASFLGQAGFVSGYVGTEHVETAVGPLAHEQLAGDVEPYEGARLDVLVRPDDLRAIPASEGNAQGRVVHRQYSGPSFTYRVELDSGDVVRCLHNHAEEFEVGDPVAVDLVADHTLAWYPAE